MAQMIIDNHEEFINPLIKSLENIETNIRELPIDKQLPFWIEVRKIQDIIKNQLIDNIIKIGYDRNKTKTTTAKA